MASELQHLQSSAVSDLDVSGRVTVQADGIDEAEWNNLLEGFADASRYQTWAYGAVSLGGKHLSRLVLAREGSHGALAQVRIVRMPLPGASIASLRWGAGWAGEGCHFDPMVWRRMIKALVQ